MAYDRVWLSFSEPGVQIVVLQSKTLQIAGANRGGEGEVLDADTKESVGVAD